MSFRKSLLSILLGFVMIFVSGCEDDDSGGGGGEIGPDNDANVAVAIGDSITEGYNANTAWPGELAAMSGKTVHNAGVGGARTSYGVSITSSVLNKYNPGYLLILFGANDMIHGADPAGVKEQLRVIIQKAKANQTRAIIATLTPMSGSHALYDGGASALSSHIRSLASEEGAGLVDLQSVFAGHPEYLHADGLHPNDLGQMAIARAFNGAL
jgi:lysophospholipase L1-like esterase